MMTVKEIADKLVELCKVGKNEEAYKTLFAENAVGVEAHESGYAETKGLNNLIERGKGMSQMWTVNKIEVGVPTIVGNYFAVGMGQDVTEKKDGHRIVMNELAVYETKDGKIIKEQFFYSKHSDKVQIKAVADKLVALCRAGKNDEAINTLYAENVVGFEAAVAHYHKTEGLANIKENSKKWAENLVTVHKTILTEPTIIGNYFAYGYAHDVEFKDRGRVAERELCVYEVKDGKVVREEFFY
jgi:ketosteroid isomerase-like protein